MKILHILVDGPSADAEPIINEQRKEHELEVVDLSAGSVSYDALVDKIAQCDQVVTW
ncbi:MAG: hypothetical protein JSW36_01650 [Burkholderiales bacterium]|nr:MAG: hypothetical protein JSW36_01650 [Burkholderiales bacterium]